jgi:hypothetical protein
MRTYVVEAGDSPGSIAIKFASCPKCSVDLVRCNDGKEIVTYPNGYVSFKELRAGEQLRLPEKWFEPRFELLPPAYFGSLPYADGVTPSPFGDLAPVVLRDFRALDVAANKLCALTTMDDATFASNMNDAADAINASVQPALASTTPSAVQYAQGARDALKWAIQCGQMFQMSLDMGATQFPAKARTDVQKALTTALGNAQYALKEMYATLQPPAKVQS